MLGIDLTLYGILKNFDEIEDIGLGLEGRSQYLFRVQVLKIIRDCYDTEIAKANPKSK